MSREPGIQPFRWIKYHDLRLGCIANEVLENARKGFGCAASSGRMIEGGVESWEL